MDDVTGRPGKLALSMIDQILGHPELFPANFKDWLIKFLSGSLLTLPAGNITGLSSSAIGSITYSTTPPANPNDGDRWIYVDSKTAPTVQWEFRYNSGSTNPSKWEFIGGSPFVRRLDGATTTTSNSYTQGGGPTITVPRTGFYLLALGFHCATFASSATTASMGYRVSGGAVDDTQAVECPVLGGISVASLEPGNLGPIALTAGDVIELMYKSDGSTNVAFNRRWAELRPIRVS